VTFGVAALHDSHDLTTFHSGNLELDRWLRDHARQATAQGTRTCVLIDDQGGAAGCFAIAPHVLDRRAGSSSSSTRSTTTRQHSIATTTSSHSRIDATGS
jgi:hypothetical protein